jgi:protein-disulfide isomerase
VQVDRTYLIAGGVALAVVLGGIGYWVWGGGSSGGPTKVASGECVPKESFDITAADHTLGRADAPITLVEYASQTCIHCARFARDVFPQLKSEYIDKGHVRYVFREFPLDQVALTASVVGRCLPRESYLAYVDLMYGELETWVQQEDLRASIKEMARRAGMTGEDFEKCLSTDEDAKKLIAGRTKATEDYCIGGTPTFFMNGKQIASGEIPWSTLDEKIRAELKAKGVEAPAAPAAPATPEGAPAEGAATTPAEGAAPATPPAEGAAPAPAAGETPAAAPPANPATPAPSSGSPTP